MKTLDEVRDFFANDKYATQVTGIEIVKADPGHSEVNKNPPDHKNRTQDKQKINIY